MTLGDAAVGSTVIVAKIDGDGAYKRRIMDMGITKGSEIFSNGSRNGLRQLADNRHKPLLTAMH